MSLGLSQNYITLRTIESGRLIHQNKLTKVKINNQMKATCYLESSPFKFKIDNFYVKEFDSKTGYVVLSVKNNLHHKLNVIYQIFDDIENEIIDTVYLNRKQWCNCDNVPRYEFQEAFHQPIKIKNNETIISCHLLNDSQEKINLINEIYKNKILVSYILQYDGFELSEYEIFPLIKIIDVKEKIIEFSKKIIEKPISCSSDSDDTESMDETNLEIYPTDIEKLEKPKKMSSTKKVDLDLNENSDENFNSNLSSTITQQLIDLVYEKNELHDNNIIQDFEYKISNLDNFNYCITDENSTFDTQDIQKYFDYDKKSNSNTNASLSLSLEENDKKNINLLNSKKIKKKNKHRHMNYVSKMELSKVKNNKELSKMLEETIANGYMSQLEKANMNM
jgi:hypothetical protein